MKKALLILLFVGSVNADPTYDTQHTVTDLVDVIHSMTFSHMNDYKFDYAVYKRHLQNSVWGGMAPYIDTAIAGSMPYVKSYVNPTTGIQRRHLFIMGLFGAVIGAAIGGTTVGVGIGSIPCPECQYPIDDVIYPQINATEFQPE